MGDTPKELGPQQQQVLAAFERTFGENAGHVLSEEIKEGKITLLQKPTGITDKDGNVLGMEAVMKYAPDSSFRYTKVGERHADGSADSHDVPDATLKVFINMSDTATMVLEDGKPAKFVDAEGHQLNKPVPADMVTANDMKTPGDSTYVVIADDKLGTPGKFSFGKTDSYHVAEINVMNDAHLDLSAMTAVKHGHATGEKELVHFTVSDGAQPTFTPPNGNAISSQGMLGARCACTHHEIADHAYFRPAGEAQEIASIHLEGPDASAKIMLNDGSGKSYDFKSTFDDKTLDQIQQDSELVKLHHEAKALMQQAAHGGGQDHSHDFVAPSQGRGETGPAQHHR